MCTVLLRFLASCIVLGAVRDEFVDRAWDPPGAHWGDRLLGGRDRTAGGTWLALDPQRRAVAAILNGVRRPPPADGVRPSRGQLPLDALRGKPLPEILDRYDGFHLVLATAGDARIWTWDGESLRETGLDSGDHVIVNQGIDPSGHPATELLPAAQTRDDWVPLLGSDVVLIDRDYAGRRYGSTSTSLVVLDGSGVRYSFNPQPRDPTAWYDIPT